MTIVNGTTTTYPPAPWSKNHPGDRRHLAQIRNVPFAIIVDQHPFKGSFPGSLLDEPAIIQLAHKWDSYKPAQQLKIILWLFSEANRVLEHLSGGQFNLRLEEIAHADDKRIDRSIDNHGFTMHVQHDYDISIRLGSYLHRGHFQVAPLGLLSSRGSILRVGTIVHEMMHGLLGGDHSNDEGGICDVLGPTIRLSRREAEYLGWPVYIPPTSNLLGNLY